MESFAFWKGGEDVFKGEFNKTKFEFVNVKKFTYDDLEAGWRPPSGGKS